MEMKINLLVQVMKNYLNINKKDENLDKILKTAKAAITELDIAYYEHSNSPVSDALYDELRELYYKLSNEKEVMPLTDVELEGEMVKHIEKIYSLDKIKTEADLRKETKRLCPAIAELKYDGLTVVVYPKKEEKSYIAVLRGDGYEGRDVTNNLKATKLLDEEKVSQLDFPFRCEAYMRKSTLASLNNERVLTGKETLKNTRNAASGMFTTQNYNEIKGIELVAYNLIGADHLSESEQLNYLYRNGIPVPAFGTVLKCNSEDEIDNFVNKILSVNRDALDYDIDGIVIKANYPYANKKWGYTEHHSKAATAYKFKSQGAWTKLVGIEWKTGKTGRVAPTGIVEPVSILGSTISRVTLNNEKFIKKFNLHIGSEVYIIKSNDVIPALEDSKAPAEDLTPVEIPTKCPECDSQLNKINDQVFCENALCKSRLIGTILHYAGRDALDIKGLGEETVQKMVDKGYINKAIDLFDITVEQILTLDGFAKKSAEKLYNDIQNSRENVPLNRFLYTACIPLVGRTASKKIVKALPTVQAIVDDIKDDCKVIRSLNDIGEKIAINMRKNVVLIALLYSKIKPVDYVEVKQVEGFKTYCLTGKMDKPREHYQIMIEKKGHKFVNSITKKVDYLVIGDNVGATKIEKAKSYGISIITLEQFKEMIGE